ncbi:ribosome hibernation-promoting factor, HPF/YfiA family [Pseudobacteriovorax antillogorgiicola]|uniref:Ribosome hibernation promoting factor n=1 Tax=Pseudobacteriovorax antillogorgiicola TaxID=1513793 RepID=A0A1Y6BZS2_9BACT|nr:ribosome-associated translation inhibitor RaiA [Pseudobacteriovorax antillogorgiicola]TCS50292.1 putative sigma-54 modulation protein [Pseudobacteriovorax antillogorgiicola]SMF33910.1 putative sigma-54 modulation protein [Pseudobacteriovorax antillogorgiicola]
MQFQFSFKHMDTSQALQDYAEEKLRTKIEKFVTKAIEVQVTFSVDRHLQHANCVLVSGDGFSLNVEHACEDMYGSVDRMIDKLGAQLKRKKDKLKSHKNKGTVRTMPEVDYSAQAEEAYSIDAAEIVKFEEARRRRPA